MADVPVFARAEAPSRHARGFSLVEVTLALGVAAFCLIVIFGLIPIGLKSNRMAVEQTAANGIISAVTTDLRAIPISSPPGLSGTSQQFGIVIPAQPISPVTTTTGTSTTLFFDGNGQFTTALGADSRYRLTATCYSTVPNPLPSPLPASGTSFRTATRVNLQVTWPAAASVQNAEGSTVTFVALDRN